MTKYMDTTTLPDIQNGTDHRGVGIDEAGIKGVRYPVCVKDRSRTKQHTVATCNMYVYLPHNLKGTHMSRFMEVLNENEYELTVRSFRNMVFEMTNRLKSQAGLIEMSFPYFIMKVAPISSAKSLMDYKVTFLGKVKENKYSLTIKVVVPVTSLCPCSKEISEHGAHNQRSVMTITTTLRNFVWIEDLIDIAEQEASCDLYGVLKRPDEKFVTETAYDNPKFVEDLARDIAIRLNKDDRIAEYTVEAENFESIHNHSAFALITSKKTKNEEFIVYGNN